MPLAENKLVTAEIRILGRLAAAGSNEVPCENVFHYARNSTVPPVTKSQLSAGFQAGIGAAILAAASSRYTPVNLTIRMIEDPTNPATVFAFAGAGAIATAQEQSTDTVVVNLYTGMRGPSHRGRKLFGGVSDADSLGDILTGAAIARWQAVRDALDDNIATADGNLWSPVLLSRKKTVYTDPEVFPYAYQINQAILNLTIGNNRRRRPATVR